MPVDETARKLAIKLCEFFHLDPVTGMRITRSSENSKDFQASSITALYNPFENLSLIPDEIYPAGKVEHRFSLSAISEESPNKTYTVRSASSEAEQKISTIDSGWGSTFAISDRETTEVEKCHRPVESHKDGTWKPEDLEASVETLQPGKLSQKPDNKKQLTFTDATTISINLFPQTTFGSSNRREFQNNSDTGEDSKANTETISKSFGFVDAGTILVVPFCDKSTQTEEGTRNSESGVRLIPVFDTTPMRPLRSMRSAGGGLRTVFDGREEISERNTQLHPMLISNNDENQQKYFLKSFNYFEKHFLH